MGIDPCSLQRYGSLDQRLLNSLFLAPISYSIYFSLPDLRFKRIFLLPIPLAL